MKDLLQMVQTDRAFTCGYCMVSIVLSKAERKDAKLMSTSTSGCFFMASLMFL